ncbi:hypothetical protein [Klebsiella pneumoniae]|uniref:hypothetical protein n=2 Tax=Klebsiella pneumoniae TaxID=573 RepID=UPI000E555525|nr:hypothetical protein [Klebsiella pneumoniae]MDU7110277.1 hypothetical protein [Clostridium perfringens]EKW7148115.1 hypothetical protein [Klebsiella pneumoniae]MCZ9544331.1 hypothetical protein [Klebsiella pneumoniae]MEB6488400.1 hypothetical protein [Klebsiella pneumoniae]RHE62403.1 hypothetical protein DW734_12775 [Klebsiella pneumoniae]
MKIKNIHVTLWGGALFCFYFLDAIDKFNRSLGDSRVAFIARMLTIAIIVCFFIFKPNILFREKRILYFVIFTSIVMLGYLVSGIYENDSLGQSFYILARYVSFIIFIYYAHYCLQSCDNSSFIFISRIMVFIFLINCIFAWFGFIFGIEILRTYGHIADLEAGWVDQRFGYDGFLLEQNNATYFYIIGLIACYWLHSEKRLNILWLLFGFISCFIVGTKSLYAAAFLLLILIIFKKRKTRVLLFSTGSTLFLCWLLFSTSVIDKVNFTLIDSTLSGRMSNYILHVYPLLERINLAQIFLGFQGGDPKKYLVEMEMIDIIQFFGLLGGFMYLFIALKEIFNIIKDSPLKLSMASISVIFIVSFFSGHLFYDPVASYYFVTLVLLVGLNKHRIKGY